LFLFSRNGCQKIAPQRKKRESLRTPNHANRLGSYFFSNLKKIATKLWFETFIFRIVPRPRHYVHYAEILVTALASPQSRWHKPSCIITVFAKGIRVTEWKSIKPMVRELDAMHNLSTRSSIDPWYPCRYTNQDCIWWRRANIN
jgi:hypothetical protein